jgi:hypothetical protein
MPRFSPHSLRCAIGWHTEPVRWYSRDIEHTDDWLEIRRYSYCQRCGKVTVETETSYYGDLPTPSRAPYTCEPLTVWVQGHLKLGFDTIPFPYTIEAICAPPTLTP